MSYPKPASTSLPIMVARSSLHLLALDCPTLEKRKRGVVSQLRRGTSCKGATMPSTMHVLQPNPAFLSNVVLWGRTSGRLSRSCLSLAASHSREFSNAPGPSAAAPLATGAVPGAWRVSSPYVTGACSSGAATTKRSSFCSALLSSDWGMNLQASKSAQPAALGGKSCRAKPKAGPSYTCTISLFSAEPRL